MIEIKCDYSGVIYYGINSLYKTILSNNDLFISSPFIYHGRVNTNDCKMFNDNHIKKATFLTA